MNIFPRYKSCKLTYSPPMLRYLSVLFCSKTDRTNSAGIIGQVVGAVGGSANSFCCFEHTMSLDPYKPAQKNLPSIPKMSTLCLLSKSPIVPCNQKCKIRKTKYRSFTKLFEIWYFRGLPTSNILIVLLIANPAAISSSILHAGASY